MQLNQIDYFLAVAKHLNFTSAANELYISQPALSKQIAMLEDELGLKLFVRNSRRVALTPAGKQYQSDLIKIREELDLAKKRVMAMADKKPEVFRIACFDGAYTNDFLPRIYNNLHEILPDTQITVFRGNFLENKKAFMDQAVDLLLTLDTEAFDDDEHIKVKLCDRGAGLIYSVNSRLNQIEHLSYSDFADEPFLLLRERISPELYKKGIEALKMIGIEHPNIIEQENFMTLMTNVILGRGFALLTADGAKGNEELKCLPITGYEGMPIVAIWERKHSLAELIYDIFTRQET